MSLNRNVRDSERRKKRLIAPMFYFLTEMTLVWLVLSLIQLEFSVLEWSTWAIIIFFVIIIYSIAKTIHIYQRQKDYSDSDERIF